MTLTTDREDVQFPVKAREDNSAPYMTAENASGMHNSMLVLPDSTTGVSQMCKK